MEKLNNKCWITGIIEVWKIGKNRKLEKLKIIKNWKKKLKIGQKFEN